MRDCGAGVHAATSQAAWRLIHSSSICTCTRVTAAHEEQQTHMRTPKYQHNCLPFLTPPLPLPFGTDFVDSLESMHTQRKGRETDREERDGEMARLNVNEESRRKQQEVGVMWEIWRLP